MDFIICLLAHITCVQAADVIRIHPCGRRWNWRIRRCRLPRGEKREENLELPVTWHVAMRAGKCKALPKTALGGWLAGGCLMRAPKVRPEKGKW